MLHRLCGTCRNVLPSDEFNGDSRRCRKCGARASLESRARKMLDEYLGDDHVAKRWKAFRDQAAKRKLYVGLTQREYAVLSSQPCHYCAARIVTGAGLDRLDNGRAYYADNVVPCCGTCNMMRGNRWSADEFRYFFGPVVRIAKAARGGTPPPDAWHLFVAQLELARRESTKSQATPVQAPGAAPVRHVPDSRVADTGSSENKASPDG